VSNIVPGRATLVHEMRAPDPAVLAEVARGSADLATEVARARRLEVRVEPISTTAPASCAERVQRAIEEACHRLGHRCQRLHSAAGHDAQNLAAVTEAGMIFIPSRGGRSHRTDEASEPEAIERGGNVLLHTLLALAG
jgi:N-carbamoyl-L-amino-acid hydrolase